MPKTATLGLVSALALVLTVPALAPASDELELDARPLSATEVAARWHGRLDSRHFIAHITLEMQLTGLRERRELLIWRDDASAAERVLIRFEAPRDLRGISLLYLERSDSANEYFLYQPALRVVRRLPESIASEDVYGIDLEFLGFGGAQTEPTEIESLASESLDGRPAYRLTERAQRKNPRFDTRITWLDRESFVPLRTEHHAEGRLELVATTLETRPVQGVPTPLRMRFEHPVAGRKIELVVESVDYESAIPPEYFSTLALIRSRFPSAPPGR